MNNPKLPFLLCLCLALLACKGPEPIRTQPTVEETSGLASIVSVADNARSGQLLSGFYQLEGNAWRWTGQKFSVALGVPARAVRDGADLVLSFSVPEPAIQDLKTIALSAKIGATDLGSETYDKAGAFQYRRSVPAPAFNGKNVVNVDFTLDKVYKAPNDRRDLGVIVRSIGLELK